MVAHALEDDQGARAVDHLGDAALRSLVRRREQAAVHVVACNLAHQLAGDLVDRDAAAGKFLPVLFEEGLQPATETVDGADGEARLYEPASHERAFGEDQALLLVRVLQVADVV